MHALAGLSLTVSRGTFVSIMGPSGSGKSTLLHLIGGLDVPDAGEIVVEGRSLRTLSDDELTLYRRRHIGFVFQFFNLLPMLSAEKNVALPLLLDGQRWPAARERVERALDLVGLARRRRHRPGELSGGEMERVAIARALVVEPLLLLADEPTGPHARGDDVRKILLLRHLDGSPPRAWGRRARTGSDRPARRFTPTRVGTNDGTPLSSASRSAGSPHARGDDVRKILVLRHGDGSAPRAWGRPAVSPAVHVQRRFTPTRVGTTWSTGRTD